MDRESFYEIVTGAIETREDWPEVKNAFADGEICDNLYGEIYEIKVRLCERLGKPGQEDSDVERIINNMFEICRIVGEKMFDCGRLQSIKN